LDEGPVVAGHSVGATILISALAEQPPKLTLKAIVLIAAPFVGEGGWQSDEFLLPTDLGRETPAWRAGSRVPWPSGRSRPTITRRPVCPTDPAGAGAPALGAWSSAKRWPDRGSKGDGRQRPRGRHQQVDPNR